MRLNDPTKASIDLVETKIASERVFDGNLLHVRRDTVRLPDARTATREYIVHPGAVAILAMFDNGDIVLERQFRFPLGRVLIEQPLLTPSLCLTFLGFLPDTRLLVKPPTL